MAVKDPKKVKSGKKSKAQGAEFERRVRKDLEEKGWIVDKWTNNVEFDEDVKGIKEKGQKDFPEISKGIQEGKLIKAKPKFVFNPGLRRRMPMGMGSGFPDFIAYKFNYVSNDSPINPLDWSEFDYGFVIIGIESKMNGKLDAEEKEKCRWLLRNKIFSKILIASKTKVKNKIVVVYSEFQ